MTDTNYALTRCQIDKCWRSEGHLFIIINVSYITSGLLLKIWHEDMESSLLKNLPRYLPRGYEARENGIVWHGRNWVVFLTSFRNKPNWTNGGFLWDFPKSLLCSTERDNLAWLAWWQKQNQDPSGGNVHHLNAAVTYSAASYVYTTTFYKN